MPFQVQSLRTCSCRMVPVLVTEIYNEFIDTNATLSVNIDCKVKEETEENLTNPNRWSFDEAAEHIFSRFMVYFLIKFAILLQLS